MLAAWVVQVHVQVDVQCNVPQHAPCVVVVKHNFWNAPMKISSSYLKHVYWIGAFLPLILKGLGNAFLMKISVALPLSCFLVHALSIHSNRSIIITALLSLLVLFEWPLVHLMGFWAFASIAILGQTTVGRALASTFLGLWLLQLTDLGSWSAHPYFAAPTFIFLYYIGIQLQVRLLYPLAFTSIICTLGQLYIIYTVEPTVTISQDPHVARGYSPGPMLAKILNGITVHPGHTEGDIAISSLIFDQGPHNANQLIVLLDEHDIQFDDPRKVLIPHNAQQIEPWFCNQLFGNQYILEAVARDGLWMANLGGSLKPKGKLLLGSLSHAGHQTFTPLVLKVGKYVYVQDSDSFVDRIANRQEHILKEIVFGRSLPRIMNLLFCIFLFLPFSAQAFVIPIVILLLQIPTVGNVRVQATLDWPHEPSKASGVMTSLVDAGYNYTMGTTQTIMLVIGAGRNAQVNTSEKLVLLEPMATVRIGQHVVQACLEPRGELNDITDSRELTLDGASQGVSTLQVDGIRVIGTGSPAKLNWSLWLNY